MFVLDSVTTVGVATAYCSDTVRTALPPGASETELGESDRLRRVLTVTVSGALSDSPSLTTSCSSYTPATSAVKVGVAVVAPPSAALLPPGFETKLQA